MVLLKTVLLLECHSGGVALVYFGELEEDNDIGFFYICFNVATTLEL